MGALLGLLLLLAEIRRLYTGFSCILVCLRLATFILNLSFSFLGIIGAVLLIFSLSV